MTRDFSRRLTEEESESVAVGEYKSLAEKVYTLSLKYYNRLIAHLRTQPGQYWLQEYPINLNIMVSDLTNFGAKAKTPGDTEWVKFRGTQSLLYVIMSDTRLEEERYIGSRDIWQTAQEFVNSVSITKLVWEILARADYLASIGHSRSALTEAATALEVAVFQFARSADNNKTFGSILAKRMNIQGLEKQVRHLGFSGTINFLFPVIFSEEQVSSVLLRVCQEAIQQRQNVVHNGQREVDKVKLRHYLFSIRSMCKYLDKLSPS